MTKKGGITVADTYELTITPGRILGTMTSSRMSGSEEPLRPYWEVPLASAERKAQFVNELAADPLAAGRWFGGQPTEDDRRRAGMEGSSWRPACTCGMRMPCRHAQSVLFQFRSLAKGNPQLWLEAAGMDAAELAAQYRKRRSERLQSMRRDSGPDVEARAKRRAADAAIDETEVLLQQLRLRFRDPLFWNRDVSMADWLLPIIEAARVEEGRGDEPHADTSDHAMDSNLRERP